MCVGFGNVALDVDLGVGHLRLRLRQLPFRLIERCLERTRIDFEQQLSSMDK